MGKIASHSRHCLGTNHETETRSWSTTNSRTSGQIEEHRQRQTYRRKCPTNSHGNILVDLSIGRERKSARVRLAVRICLLFFCFVLVRARSTERQKYKQNYKKNKDQRYSHLSICARQSDEQQWLSWDCVASWRPLWSLILVGWMHHWR